MQNGTTTSENTLAVSYKLKHILNIRPSNSTLRYLLKKNEWNEKTNLCKDVCTNAHITIIHNSLKLKVTQISTNRWAEKQIVIQTHTGMLLSTETEQTTEKMQWYG